MQTAFRRTFASLGVYNYRLYFIGQGISMCGSWMQTVAMSLLALKLTNSGTQLGLILAAQFLPMLLFGMYGGVIADRFNKRKILYATQTIQGVLALTFGLLIVTNSIQLWMVYAMAACLGLTMLVDNPTRQTFIIEMVGPDMLRNAVTLNSTLVNTARVVGPSIAAGLIASKSIAFCFLANAASYLAILAALFIMRGNELHTNKPVEAKPNQVIEGFRYAWHMPVLRATLIMMLIIGTFTYEFNVTLPLLAVHTFHGNATTYSLMTAAMGIGAILGGLYTAGRGTPHPGRVAVAALLFGIGMALVGVAPNLPLALFLLFAMGGLSVLFISLGNTTLQLTSEPSMRGRVMALWTIAFAGTTPIGGPIVGVIADHTSARLSIIVGGIAALIAGLIGARILQKNHQRLPTDQQKAQTGTVRLAERA